MRLKIFGFVLISLAFASMAWGQRQPSFHSVAVQQINLHVDCDGNKIPKDGGTVKILVQDGEVPPPSYVHTIDDCKSQQTLSVQTMAVDSNGYYISPQPVGTVTASQPTTVLVVRQTTQVNKTQLLLDAAASFGGAYVGARVGRGECCRPRYHYRR